MNKNKYEVATLFCPNCGHRIVGLREEDGSLRQICDRCRVYIYSKPKNEKVIKIKVELISSF